MFDETASKYFALVRELTYMKMSNSLLHFFYPCTVNSLTSHNSDYIISSFNHFPVISTIVSAFPSINLRLKIYDPAAPPFIVLFSLSAPAKHIQRSHSNLSFIIYLVRKSIE